MSLTRWIGLCLLMLGWVLVTANASASANRENGSISLESTFVGDKEQPPVSYFIPWQGVGVSNRLYRSIDGRLDNTLAPVDRDVLIRSIRVYSDMNVENR